MKCFFSTILLLLAFGAGAQTPVYPGQLVNKYWISGSLAVGKGERNLVANDNAWLELGKDSTNKGFLMARGVLADIAVPTKGLFFFSDTDSVLYGFDGLRWVRYMTYKDSAYIRQIIGVPTLDEVTDAGANTPNGITVGGITSLGGAAINNGLTVTGSSIMQNLTVTDLSVIDSANFNGAVTATNPVVIQRAFVGTSTTTDGLVLTNPTAATSGVTRQYSPALRFRGSNWNTSVSRTHDVKMQVEPGTSGIINDFRFRFQYSYDGAAPVDLLSITRGVNTATITTTQPELILSNSPSFVDIASSAVVLSTPIVTFANAGVNHTRVHNGTLNWTFGGTADNSLGKVQVIGNIYTSGKLNVATGANAAANTVALVAGTVTVPNTSVTANSLILLTPQAGTGSPAAIEVTSRVAGTSFTITSASPTDTRSIGYFIIN